LAREVRSTPTTKQRPRIQSNHYQHQPLGTDKIRTNNRPEQHCLAIFVAYAPVAASAVGANARHAATAQHVATLVSHAYYHAVRLHLLNLLLLLLSRKEQSFHPHNRLKMQKQLHKVSEQPRSPNSLLCSTNSRRLRLRCKLESLLPLQCHPLAPNRQYADAAELRAGRLVRIAAKFSQYAHSSLLELTNVSANHHSNQTATLTMT
jgi:hypothetical protein